MSFKAIAREFLMAVKGDLTGYTSEEPVIVEQGNEITLLTPSHIQFAKYGRGPGKQPPVDAIIEYVSAKRFQFRDKRGRFISYEGTAWAIARSIAEKGTLNWVPNAPNAIEEAVNNHVLDYYKKMEAFVIETYDPDIQKVYEKLYPRKVTIKL